MPFPVATKKSAFLAGASLAVIAVTLDALKTRGVVPYDADSGEVFPFVLVYFFVTAFVFVIGVKSIAPKELETRFPGVYFPTNRQGVRFLFTVWGRIVLWFIGAATTGLVLGSLERLLR